MGLWKEKGLVGKDLVAFAVKQRFHIHGGFFLMRFFGLLGYVQDMELLEVVLCGGIVF